MNYFDICSGIGGFALGAYNSGIRFNNHYCSEIEPFPASVYQKRFPDSVNLGDLTKIKFEDMKNEESIISAGIPCQPHSEAGKKKGAGDKRDLWPFCKRTIRILRPRFAIIENVPGLFTSGDRTFFGGILKDLAECGYDAEWQIISAEEVGADTLRKRVFLVAYPSGERSQRGSERREDNKSGRPEQVRFFTDSSKAFTSTRFRENRDLIRCTDGAFRAVKPGVPLLVDALPGRVDRVKSFGNSIVPQIAEMIFRRINEIIETPN